MSWLASIFIGLLTGGLGLGLAGVIANACVSWYRISSFEGKAGYFVVFTALLGGVAGFILGVVAARIAAGAQHGFVKGLVLALAVTAGIGGVAALVSWRLADIPPEIDGSDLDLQVEIRLPAAHAAPADSAGNSHLRLGSVVNSTYRKSEMGELHIADARLEDGRWIVAGTVYVFTSRGFVSCEGCRRQRQIRPQLPKTEFRTFYCGSFALVLVSRRLRPASSQCDRRS